MISTLPRSTALLSAILALFFGLQAAAAGSATHPGMMHTQDSGALDPAQNGPAFLILAPDRGFLGNEELRDLMERVGDRLPEWRLAFATEEKPRENLMAPLSELRAGSASREVVVLPLFMSEHEALFRATSSILLEDRQVTIAEPFGKSYLAEELLFDQVEALAKNTYFAHHASHHE